MMDLWRISLELVVPKMTLVPHTVVVRIVGDREVLRLPVVECSGVVAEPEVHQVLLDYPAVDRTLPDYPVVVVERSDPAVVH